MTLISSLTPASPRQPQFGMAVVSHKLIVALVDPTLPPVPADHSSFSENGFRYDLNDQGSPDKTDYDTTAKAEEEARQKKTRAEDAAKASGNILSGDQEFALTKAVTIARINSNFVQSQLIGRAIPAQRRTLSTKPSGNSPTPTASAPVRPTRPPTENTGKMRKL